MSDANFFRNFSVGELARRILKDIQGDGESIGGGVARGAVRAVPVAREFDESRQHEDAVALAPQSVTLKSRFARPR